MKPMGCFRVAAVLTGWMLVGLPVSAALADAAWVNPDDAAALHAASWAPPLTGEGPSPMAGDDANVTLSVNAAIMVLGSAWLVLMARRIQGRDAADGMDVDRMLSGGAPRHVAGGR